MIGTSNKPYPESTNRETLERQHDDTHCPKCKEVDDDMWRAVFGDAGICCCRSEKWPGSVCKVDESKAAQ